MVNFIVTFGVEQLLQVVKAADHALLHLLEDHSQIFSILHHYVILVLLYDARSSITTVDQKLQF